MAEPANQGNERGDTGPTWPQDGNTQLSLVTSPSSTSTSNAPPLTTSLASPGPSRGRPSLSQGASNSGNGNTTSSTPSSSDDLPTDVIIDLMRNASRAWDPQADFEIDELAALLNRCSSYKLKKGSPIINRSDVASFIAFVLAGAAKVVVGTEEVATLTTGSVLGAEAYFNRAQTRSADVVAGEGTVLIALQYDTIPTLATENPLLYSKFLKMLCVQAVMGTQRQAMDRHRMSLPLYDSVCLLDNSTPFRLLPCPLLLPPPSSILSLFSTSSLNFAFFHSPFYIFPNITLPLLLKWLSFRRVC